MTDDRLTSDCSHLIPADPTGQPLHFDPRWRSETVLALARGIDADAAFDRLPILADALEEAGCDLIPLLTHCRHCPTHASGCWVVNLTLDRPAVPPPPSPSLDPALIDLLRRAAERRPARASAREPAVPGMPVFRVLYLLGLVALCARGCMSLIERNRPSSPPIGTPVRQFTTPTTTRTAADQAVIDAMQPSEPQTNEEWVRKLKDAGLVRPTTPTTAAKP